MRLTTKAPRAAACLFFLFVGSFENASAGPLPLGIDFLPDGRVHRGPDPLLETNWNECRGNLTGNYVGLPCNTNRGMANEFLAFLRDNLFRCVDAGLARVGGGHARALHLVHDGTVADENHSSRSLHAVGRAIDILQVQVTLASAGGPSPRVFNFRDTSSNPGGVDRRFFEGFRACWGVLNARRDCPKRQDGYPVGTIGWEDDRHRGHHLHTSMPFCPDSEGHMITEIPY